MAEVDIGRTNEISEERRTNMADDVSKITSSGTNDVSKLTTYKASSNDKNTLSITNYFQLLATQLANQDYTNPMDNSEMMAQTPRWLSSSVRSMMDLSS